MEQMLHKDSILRLARHPLYYISTLLYSLWSIYLAANNRFVLKRIGYFPEFRFNFAALSQFLSQVFPLFLCIGLIILAICGLRKAVSQRACVVAQIGLVALILSYFFLQVASIATTTVTVYQFVNTLPVLISGFVGNFVCPVVSTVLAICYLQKAKRNTAVFLAVFLFVTTLFKLTDLLVCAKYLAQGFQMTFWGYVFGYPFESFLPMIITLCFAVLLLWAARQKSET